MKPTTCYACQTILTKGNESVEHIILNACGGRLKSRRLLCKTCNSIYGDSCDKELALQVNDLVNYLMIERERGEAQPFKAKDEVTGEEYKYLNTGELMKSKPEVTVTKKGEQVHLYVSASNDVQFNDVLSGLIKKYPMLSKAEVLAKTARSEYFIRQPLHAELNVGGDEVFRSLAKSAINFYLHTGGEVSAIRHLIPYLGGTTKLPLVWYYFPEKPVYVAENGEVSHLIVVVGNPQEKLLYAYIELFNYMNVIVLLNEDYHGPAVHEVFYQDLLTKVAKEPSVDLDLDRKTIVAVLHQRAMVQQPLVDRLNRVWKIADGVQTSFHFNKLLKRALDKAAKNFPPGTKVTEEIAAKLGAQVTNELLPFMANLVNKSDRSQEH